MKKEQRLKLKIKELKKEMNSLGDLFPGSLSQQWNICGNPGCKCKDKQKPIKHGPYYNVSYKFRGKSHTKFVRSELVEKFQQYTDNFKRFRECSDLLIGHYIELIKLRSQS